MEYTLREEIANAITHGIGIVFSIAALVLMVVFSSLYGDVWHIVSVSIYGASLVLLYTFSTLLHSFQYKPVKNIFEYLDHAAIYLLIAGTYTPFLMVTLRGTLGWTLLAVIWVLAIAGIIFKMIFVKRFIVLSTLLYIILGWMIVVAIRPLYENLATGGLVWLVLGGLLYTFGTIFFIWRRIPFHHAIWHVFVLGGSVAHFIAVLFYVIPIWA
ncbi:hemolysin D [Desulfuribacillus stibiiarsenatis]|uniref:Hemolysin D n=1 Tax=Desulfuribacillus stibiiarsenatis TaxID=1390249 RepID=A0A1E5L7K8_9FIRM|nr:hemolysin III family protein [Desulfuribacillus stibiiarsenatis]OEH85994.1 hemolysin D [Desulfuribacillus stibiiarsenatis]